MQADRSYGRGCITSVIILLLAVGYSSGTIGGWLTQRPHYARFLQRFASGILIALGIRLALIERQ